MELLKNVYDVENAYIIEDYPYGFRLRTTMRVYLEKSKRGYRICRVTENPKTGKLNKPKKSTYSEYMRLYKNEDGHIKAYEYNGNSPEAFLKAQAKGIFEDDVEVKQLGEAQRIISIKAMVIYGGYDFELIKDFSLERLVEIDGDNEYKIPEARVEGWSPFKVTHHTIAKRK